MTIRMFLTLATIGAVMHWHALVHDARAEAPAASYTLSELMSLALEGHPSIKEAEGQIQQSQGYQQQTQAYPNPTFIGQSGAGSVRDPSNGFQRQEIFLTVEQPVEWPGMRAARQQAAAAAATGADIAKDEAVLRVQTEVKIAFYETLLAQQTVETSQRKLAMVEKTNAFIHRRVEVGETAPFEALQAQVALRRARTASDRARQTFRARRADLNALTGGTLNEPFRVEGSFRNIPSHQALDRLARHPVSHHPSTRRAGKRVEEADFTIAMERHSLVPQVSLFGGYARDAGREAGVAGLLLPLPLWYQRQGEIAEATGLKRQREAERGRITNELERLVTSRMQDIKTAIEEVEVFQDWQLKQAEEQLRIADARFRAGDAGLQHVLEARAELLQVQLAYARARRDLSVALAQFEYAIGGES